MRLLDHRQAADAGADAHADALAIARVVFERRVLDRFHRRDQAVMDEGVVAARLLAGQMLRDVEALHLAGNLRGKRVRVEARDARDAGAAGEDVLPRRVERRLPTGETIPSPVTTTRRLDMGERAARALARRRGGSAGTREGARRG